MLEGERARLTLVKFGSFGLGETASGFTSAYWGHHPHQTRKPVPRARAREDCTLPTLTSGSPPPSDAVKTSVVSASISALCVLTSRSGYFSCVRDKPVCQSRRVECEREAPPTEGSGWSPALPLRTCRALRTALAETLDLSALSRMRACPHRRQRLHHRVSTGRGHWRSTLFGSFAPVQASGAELTMSGLRLATLNDAMTGRSGRRTMSRCGKLLSLSRLTPREGQR